MRNILLGVVLFLPAFSWSQVSLTLNSAIDTALQNNFEIQIARNNTEISRINNSYGNAGGLPSLNINASKNNSLYDLNQKLNNGTVIKKDNVTNSSYNTGLSAGMILFNGLKVLATKKKLSLLVSKSELDFNNQVENTIAAVMVRYYDIVRQETYLKIIEASVELNSKKSAIVQERYNIGMANDADVLQAQIDLTMSEQNLISQKVIIEQAKTNLLEILAVNEFYSYTVVDSINVDNTLQIDSILTVLENNPQYLSAEQQVRIYEQIVREVQAQRYPSVRISGGYNFIYNSSSAGFNLFTQNSGPTFGATLQIPLFNGTIYKTQQDVARYNVINAELQKESLFNAIKTDAVRTYQSYESTLRQIEIQKSSYKSSEKLINLILQKFSLGQATILDVRAAQLSFESAGYLLVNLEYSAKIAEIELKRMIYALGFN